MTITPTDDLNSGDPRLSFYLTIASNECGEGLDLARKADGLAGALTIAGPKGPGRIHRLRALGITVPIYFDAEGYKRQSVPETDEWVQTQRQVGGAERALLPGVSLEWNDGDHQVLRRLIHEQGRLSEANDAVMLLRTDHGGIGALAFGASHASVIGDHVPLDNRGETNCAQHSVLETAAKEGDSAQDSWRRVGANEAVRRLRDHFRSSAQSLNLDAG